MSLDSDYVAKVTTPKQDGGFVRGTAYPIREGVIITAYHVIPDIENYKQTSLIWGEQEDKSKKTITHILYESKENDIVIAECETPPNPPKSILCKDRPSSTLSWDSFGYARSAIDYKKEQHKLESAGGTYYTTPKNSEVQQLSAKDKATDNKFWKGMSGAPIFTADTDFLIGIFIETSLVYEDKESNEKEVFKGRLRAASIAYLLENDQDDKFAEAVYGKDYRNYKNKGKEKLQVHLEKLNKDFPRLCEQLPKLDDLLSRLNQNTIACIRDLKKQCAGLHLVEAQKQIEIFFYLLLSQLDVPCRWEGKHHHELQVSTRLLAELSIARLYL